MLKSKAQQSLNGFQYMDPPEDLTLFGDPKLLEMVVINILQNAFEANYGNPSVQVTLSSQMDTNGRVNILISDNGVGIVEEAMNKIFIPFYTTKKTGSGIGLSLSRQIVQMHHGQLTVRSKPGFKTVFAIRI